LIDWPIETKSFLASQSDLKTLAPKLMAEAPAHQKAVAGSAELERL
jgi:hypothetical protein